MRKGATHERSASEPTGVITIERVSTADLRPRVLGALVDLWAEAYREDLGRYFEDIGHGVHFIGRRGTDIVSHAMWVERKLYPRGLPPLRSAYVELVATRVAERGKRYATAVMERLADEIRAFDLGALSPAVPRFYERLGWEMWRGPLFVRGGDMPPVPDADAASGAVRERETPDEFVMVLRTPKTPGDLDLNAPLAVDWRRGEVW